MRARFRTNLIIISVFFTFILTCKYLVVQQVVRSAVVKTTPSTISQASSLMPYKHVTKSLRELGKMDEISKHVLFLNRVPKSGSEILVVLLKWLQGWNTFRHVRLKGNKKKLANIEQEELVYNAYDTIRNEAVPMSFDRDVYFINFTRFDRQSPTFINLIRDPADYLLASFHYLVHTSTKYDTKKLRTPQSIEECIMRRNVYCVFKSGASYDLSIPYFCGQDPRCSLLNDDWALKQAMINVNKYYSVIGILEEVNTTLEVFENKLPYFFKGVQDLYYRDLLEPFHRNNRKTPKASEKFRKHAKRMLNKELFMVNTKDIDGKTHGEIKTVFKKKLNAKE